MAPSATEATLRFTTPDPSITRDQRSVFSAFAPKDTINVKLPLHDMRNDDRLSKGSEGLDAQGFTLIQHRSALAESDQWFSSKAISEIYNKEACDLLREVTGASRIVVVNTASRNRLADELRDPTFYHKRGHPIELDILALPKDIPLTFGTEKGTGLEPLSYVHIDYSIQGLQTTIRECRKDISATGKPVIDALDANARGQNVRVPRHAAYSVWRPVRQVKRDPLAVADIRTMDMDEIREHDYRAISETNPSGDYGLDYLHIYPPKDLTKPRWYWAPDMTPDEVLIVKFADSESVKNPDVALGCPHTSAMIPGTEDDTEPRCSVEVRCVAFWD